MDLGRFSLNTARMIPRWFILLWDVSILLILALGVVAMVVNPELAMLPFFVVGVLMSGLMHLMAWGYGKAEWNFVELQADGFDVRLFQPLSSFHKKVLYSWVDEVGVHGRHSGWWPFGYWPYTGMQAFAEHVDVRLRKTVFLSGGWGRPSPWVRVIHLDVNEPEAFAEAFRTRAVASADSRA